MTVDTLYMGDTSPGEYLKRGTGADSDKIVSGTVSGGGGSGDSIENVAETANVTVNADDTVSVNAEDLILTEAGANIVFSEVASEGDHTLGIGAGGVLEFDGIAVGGGGSSDSIISDNSLHNLTINDSGDLTLDGDPLAVILVEDPEAVHGQQRLKDGVHQIYIEDEWIDQIEGKFWNGDRTQHMALFPNDITEFLAGRRYFKEAVDGTNYVKTGEPVTSFYRDTGDFEFYIMLKHPMRVQELRLRTDGINNSLGSLVNIEASNDMETWTVIREDIPKFSNLGDDNIRIGSDEYKTYKTIDDGTLYQFLRCISYNAGGLATDIFDVSVKAIGRPSGSKPATYNIYEKTYNVTVPNMAIFDAVNNDTSKIYSGHGMTSGLAWAVSQPILTSDEIEIEFDLPADVSGMSYMQSNNATHGDWRVFYYDGAAWQLAADTFTLGGARHQSIFFSGSYNSNLFKLQGRVGPGNSTGATSSDIYWIAFDEKNKPVASWVGGDRTSIWTMTGDIGLQAGTYSNLVDGDTDNDTYFTSGGSPVAGKFIKAELTTPSAITGFRWEQNNASSHGIWDIETSTDNVTWVTRASGITLGGASSTDYSLSADSTIYTYLRIIGVSGNTSSSPYLYNFDIQII